MWSKKGPEAQPSWLTQPLENRGQPGFLSSLSSSFSPAGPRTFLCSKRYHRTGTPLEFASHGSPGFTLTDTDLIKQCIDECTARIEIGLHYQIPYPRPIHLPPMGLTPLRGRGLRSQEKLRKFSKPIYLKSHDEVS
ncbi:LYR motif-containing protein 1 isoform X1 [Ovis canadensis]|uniref:LYR motif-containing protein 1 isoform X1 n=1 Tax=Ovis canadensis TaxID=37174 RepID=UPI0037506BDF